MFKTSTIINNKTTFKIEIFCIPHLYQLKDDYKLIKNFKCQVFNWDSDSVITIVFFCTGLIKEFSCYFRTTLEASQNYDTASYNHPT